VVKVVLTRIPVEKVLHSFLTTHLLLYVLYILESDLGLFLFPTQLVISYLLNDSPHNNIVN